MDAGDRASYGVAVQAGNREKQGGSGALTLARVAAVRGSKPTRNVLPNLSRNE